MRQACATTWSQRRLRLRDKVRLARLSVGVTLTTESAGRGETPIYEQHFPHLESLTSASLCGWPCGKEFFQWLLDVYMGFRVQAGFSRQREFKSQGEYDICYSS